MFGTIFLDMDVSENSGFPPKSSHFDRVFHDFHHPFLGFFPLFLETPIFMDIGKLLTTPASPTWQVSRWSLLPIKVRLSGTHHYLLNEENVS